MLYISLSWTPDFTRKTVITTVTTLPETNSKFAPENGFLLEDYYPFLWEKGPFLGANLLLVLGRLVPYATNNQPTPRFMDDGQEATYLNELTPLEGTEWI